VKRIARFPFPFRSDTYRYRTDVEPAREFVTTAAGGWGDRVLDIDGEYHDELRQRAGILRRDPSRCTVLPHMRVAAWDALLLLLTELAATYPRWMTLTSEGRRYRWHNGLLGRSHDFVLGDGDSLPCHPLRFAGSQVQDDIVLLDQREGALWADAGLVTFAAGWSLGFDVGMRLAEVHGPVPRVHAEGVITRAEQFLLRLQPGQEYRRTNWSMTVGRRLDTSTEAYPEWAGDRHLVAADNALPDRLHLRVEVQHLLRLPASGAILFLIRTHLASLREVAEVPGWGSRLASVLAELPPDMVDYKGLAPFRDAAVDWLVDRRS
jgi:dimethylamine monooxygenase subunit A